jgi:hypothetical protein
MLPLMRSRQSLWPILHRVIATTPPADAFSVTVLRHTPNESSTPEDRPLDIINRTPMCLVIEKSDSLCRPLRST